MLQALSMTSVRLVSIKSPNSYPSKPVQTRIGNSMQPCCRFTERRPQFGFQYRSAYFSYAQLSIIFNTQCLIVTKGGLVHLIVALNGLNIHHHSFIHLSPHHYPTRPKCVHPLHNNNLTPAPCFLEISTTSNNLGIRFSTPTENAHSPQKPQRLHHARLSQNAR